MRTDCIEAVVAAAKRMGRELSAQDLRDIEGRIRRQIDYQWQTNRPVVEKLSPGERIRQAADQVAKDLVADKDRHARNIAETIVKENARNEFIRQAGKRGMSHIEALERTINSRHDLKANVKSLEQERNGVTDFYMRQLGPIADATSKYAGFFVDKKMTDDMVREGYGQDTKNPRAKEMMRLWLQNVAEPMREQYNSLGGAIRKLAGWALPQHHDWYKAAQAGEAKWREATTRLLDRKAYINEDGTLMSDTQFGDLLSRFYRTISTDGADDGLHPSSGSMADRGMASRVLHFKDGDSYLEYQKQFGSNSLLETMTNHVTSMSRNIASLKAFGAQDFASFKRSLDAAYKLDMARDPSKKNDYLARAEMATTAFKISSGRLGVSGNPTVSKAYQAIRSVISAIHLGSAAISAITDSSNIIMAAKAWKMPMVGAWAKWESKAWASRSFRQHMLAQGVGLESVLHQTVRFGEDVYGHGMPATLANQVFRLTGLNFEDMVRRQATGAMLMSRVGQLVKEFGSLNAKDEGGMLDVVKGAGTTDGIWNVWRKAKLDQHGTLSPDAIMSIPESEVPHAQRVEAAQHLLGVVTKDVNTIVPMMTDFTRTRVENTMQSMRGKPVGEFIRSIMQFKSFVISILANHWQRMQAMPTPGGKAMYAAQVVATASILGALVEQIHSMVAGNNPQDMTDPKFAVRSMMRGGTLGMYGDILGNLYASPYRENLADYLGPMFSTANDLYSFGQDAVHSAADPQSKANLGGNAVRLIKSNTPFMNFWYTKAVFDHLLFQRLQDYYSPGYAQRMQRRMQKFYGAGAQWWKPSTAASPAQIATGSTQGITKPDTPNLRTAIGEQ